MDRIDAELDAARALIHRHRLEEARERLTEILKRDNTCLETYAGLSEVFRQAGKTDLAVRCRDAALELSPRIAEARTASEGPACRLCAGPTSYFGADIVLARHPVAYWRCRQCESLQTDEPFWLDEAYPAETVGWDFGIGRRTLCLFAETLALLSLLKCEREWDYLDYGGGNGLFTNLMRTDNYRFQCYDAFNVPYYAEPFAVSDLSQCRPKVVTAYEVLEHFTHPRADLDRMMALEPELVLVSTALYRGYGLDWVYIGPWHGQHVFFYSPKAIKLIAERYGMHYLGLGSILVLVRPSFVEAAAARGVDVFAALRAAADREAFIEQGVAMLGTYIRRAG